MSDPKRVPPQIIQDVGFDFRWDERKVWQLDISVESMPIDQLTWHFDVPFLWTEPDGFYNLLPREVIEHPDQQREQYDRTLAADMSYPIDIMEWRGRWLILDGLHRLMKLFIKGEKVVRVRKIPESAIPQILKDQ